MNNEQISERIYEIAEIVEDACADPKKEINRNEMHSIYLMLHLLGDELAEL